MAVNALSAQTMVGLKELDAKRAAAFLIPFLSKNQPARLRLKAIEALGWSSFHDAIRSISAIATDVTESDEIRGYALNPGLRYMNHAEAVKTATALTSDMSIRVRSGAYWVLSKHATDEAIQILAMRLRANDKPLLGELINALSSSKHPRAGKIVYDFVDFAALPKDEDHLYAYAIAMEQYRLPEAQRNMRAIAEQPERPLSSYRALRYFASFPSADVVLTLVAFIDRIDPEFADMYDLSSTVTEFMKSPEDC